MTDKPIIFSADMVRAILDGRKTQTRRVIKPQPKGCNPESESDGLTWAWCIDGDHDYHERIRIPYATSDTLWVREAWQLRRLDGPWDALYPEDVREWVGPIPKELPKPTRQYPWGIDYKADVVDDDGLTWRPSIHMPRWASRISLRVTDVRVERVQDISEEDAQNEGCVFGCDSADWFRELWDSINQKRGYGWDANPWVWAISFERIRP